MLRLLKSSLLLLGLSVAGNSMAYTLDVADDVFTIYQKSFEIEGESDYANSGYTEITSESCVDVSASFSGNKQYLHTTCSEEDFDGNVISETYTKTEFNWDGYKFVEVTLTPSTCKCLTENLYLTVFY